MVLAHWIKPICTFNFFWKPSALSSYFVKERNEIEKDNKMLTRQVSTYTVFVSLNCISPVWLFLKLEWKFGLILFNVAALDWTGKNIWTEEFWKEKQNFTDLKKQTNKSTLQLRGHNHHMEVLQDASDKLIALIGTRASLVAQPVKNLPAMQESRVPSLGREDPLEKGMATHCSILAWRIPWIHCAGKWVLQKCLEICFLKWVKDLSINFFRLSILTENFLSIIHWRQSHNY